MSSKKRARKTSQLSIGSYVTYDKLPGFTIQFLGQGDLVDFMRITVEPGAKSERFKHKGEEGVYVVDGELEITLGDETRRLGAGETLWHSSTIPHVWENVGEKRAQLIAVAAPRSYLSLVLDAMKRKAEK